MTSNKEASLCDTTKTAASELEDTQSGKTGSRQEEENKLILNAWQSMQHSLCEGSTAPEPPQSFLAKQRQSTKARRTLSTRTEPRYEP